MTLHSDNRLRLGFDTGGTYTDAVLYSPARGVVATAKALTTRHDLSIGISGAASAVIAKANIQPSDIGLVSMSTTLATNALVEGQGGRVALIGIGFEASDLTRGGLTEALGKDPLILVAGGHDASGRAKPLDLDALEKAIVELGDTVTGIAIAALFAVRNPAHEIAARELVHKLGHIPVTLSHELSSKLGGPRRALTTLLNARLVGLIGRLIEATEGFLKKSGINAPLMVVRGDGALVSAAFAADRPIETILSGPAASLVGAQFLTGLENAVISDIGGTTTDIALLTNGRPRLDDEGATVGGFRTMVEAVAMRTHGLGGDSEVSVPDGGLEARLVLGPRRILPLALSDAASLPMVMATLEKQIKNETQNRLDGRFAFRTGLADRFAAGLSASEAALYGKLTTTLQPLTDVIASAPQITALNRLVVRGLAMISGFTPTDAQHVLGRQTTGNLEAAELGAALMARKRDGRGLAIAASAEDMAAMVVAELERKSAELVLEAAFSEDGLDGAAMLKSPLVQRAMAGQTGVAKFGLSLDRPVIGLGASASLVYPQVGKLLQASAVIPEHADVANAVGAVVGEVRVKVSAHVSQPEEGVFVVSVADIVKSFRDEASALSFAESEASKIAMERADVAGASDAHVDLARDLKAATIEGQRKFIEATIDATAHGRPRLGT
ncbi:MAG: hydantoinase/oxoprolinase N-terminal domain-containing protein [Rhizobiaceae bacterium]